MKKIILSSIFLCSPLMGANFFIIGTDATGTNTIGNGVTEAYTGDGTLRANVPANGGTIKKLVEQTTTHGSQGLLLRNMNGNFVSTSVTADARLTWSVTGTGSIDILVGKVGGASHTGYNRFIVDTVGDVESFNLTLSFDHLVNPASNAATATVLGQHRQPIVSFFQANDQNTDYAVTISDGGGTPLQVPTTPTDNAFADSATNALWDFTSTTSTLTDFTATMPNWDSTGNGARPYEGRAGIDRFDDTLDEEFAHVSTTVSAGTGITNLEEGSRFIFTFHALLADDAQPVPEPSVALLGCVGILGLLRRRR